MIYRKHKANTPIAFAILLLITILSGCCSNHESSSSNVPNSLREAINTFNQNAMHEPYATPACYHERGLVSNECASYAEALGTLMYHGAKCEIPPASLTFIPSYINKNSSSDKWLSLLKNTYEGSGGSLTEQSSFPPEYTTLTNAYRWFEIKGPLSKENDNRFSYYKEEKHGSTSAYKFETKDPNEKPFYKGTFYVNTQAKRIDSIVLSDARIYSKQHFDIVNGWLKAIYSHEEQKVWLQQLSGGYSQDGICLSISILTAKSSPTPFSPEPNDFKVMSKYSENPMVRCNANLRAEGLLLGVDIDKPDLFCTNQADSLIRTNLTRNEPFFTQRFANGDSAPEQVEKLELYVKSRVKEIIGN